MIAGRCWRWYLRPEMMMLTLELSVSPVLAVHCQQNALSGQSYGNCRDLMGFCFYLNWNCLIYKLIYFLHSKNTPHQTADYKPRMRLSTHINSLLSTTKENESLKKYLRQFTRYFNHQNTSRSNIKIQWEGILHFLENALYFYFSSHQNSSEKFSQVVWQFVKCKMIESLIVDNGWKEFL